MTHIAPIERKTFSAQSLMMDHPPRWRHRNKQTVFEIACPAGSHHSGELRYSRWRAMRLPDRPDPGAAARMVSVCEDIYDYRPVAEADGGVEWHVNFADPHLFVAYASPLFAQDEMQVAEHPILGALKESLDANGMSALTEERGQATPILIMGTERRCRVAVDANAALGRPGGLYGNAFGRASTDAIRRATTLIDPPTRTNLIAMAAPSGGEGPYRRDEIEHILTTAFTGFRAAVFEAAHACGQPVPVVVHTGFWGCGAFGGNRVLMAALQLIAAEMAGLRRLIFHTVHSTGVKPLEQARKLVGVELASSAAARTYKLIDRIAALGFEWGVSDGN